VNPAAGDLHLKPTASALLNQIGVVHPAAPVDWDGQPRPAGAADIGADELSGGTSTPPNPPANLRVTGVGGGS
jgi:hypothetical protein